jgi:C4-dicarboxylate-binding protein DctP
MIPESGTGLATHARFDRGCSWRRTPPSRNNKKGNSVIKTVMAVCLGIAILAGAVETNAAPVVIRFSHVVAEDTPKGKGALLFKQLVEERLGDQVKVEVFPNSSLYGDADELAALRDNKVQLLAPSLAKFETYTHQLRVFDLPFLFDDLDAVDRFQKRAKGRQLLYSMEQHDILGLGYWHNGMKQLSATRALRLPADAAGLNFRIQQSDVLETQFRQVKAQTTRLAFSQVFDALASGQVQGAENPWSNLYSQRFHEVQPYITETNHGVLDYMLVTNARFWYAIPHRIRTQLEALIDEVSYAVNREAAQLNEQDRQRVAASGRSQIISLSPREREAWRAAMEPVWRHFEADIGPDVLKAARASNRRDE